MIFLGTSIVINLFSAQYDKPFPVIKVTYFDYFSGI